MSKQWMSCFLRHYINLVNLVNLHTAKLNTDSSDNKYIPLVRSHLIKGIMSRKRTTEKSWLS